MSLQAVRKFPQPVDRSDEIRAGRQALAGYRWPQARAHFEAALDLEETPEALEGLAEARFWTGEVVESFPLRERAYALYRQRGDQRSAARLAIALGLSYAAVAHLDTAHRPLTAGRSAARARRRP